jgi:hypothetical protein
MRPELRSELGLLLDEPVSQGFHPERASCGDGHRVPVLKGQAGSRPEQEGVFRAEDAPAVWQDHRLEAHELKLTTQQMDLPEKLGARRQEDDPMIAVVQGGIDGYPNHRTARIRGRFQDLTLKVARKPDAQRGSIDRAVLDADLHSIGTRSERSGHLHPSR